MAKKQAKKKPVAAPKKEAVKGTYTIDGAMAQILTDKKLGSVKS